MTCSFVRIIHYTSGILVKIMYLSQLFFHMLTLRALMKLNVPNHQVSDLNVYMNQYH